MNIFLRFKNFKFSSYQFFNQFWTNIQTNRRTNEQINKQTVKQSIILDKYTNKQTNTKSVFYYTIRYLFPIACLQVPIQSPFTSHLQTTRVSRETDSVPTDL